MLVLKRKEGQWIEVTHRSGDVMRIRVCKIEPGNPGHLNLAFDDDARNFEIERPERHANRVVDPVSLNGSFVRSRDEFSDPAGAINRAFDEFEKR